MCWLYLDASDRRRTGSERRIALHADSRVVADLLALMDDSEKFRLIDVIEQTSPGSEFLREVHAGVGGAGGRHW